MVKTSLYRHFSAEGVLLYVGISKNAVARLGGHQAKSWYHQIASVTIEHHKSRRHALYHEALAIRDEKPLFNLAKPLPKNPNAPANIPSPVFEPRALEPWPRKLGYACGPQKFVDAHLVALRDKGVFGMFTFIDILDDPFFGEKPNLQRLMKTAHHKGIEVYTCYLPNIGKENLRILEERGVIVKCAA